MIRVHFEKYYKSDSGGEYMNVAFHDFQVEGPIVESRLPTWYRDSYSNTDVITISSPDTARLGWVLKYL